MVQRDKSKKLGFKFKLPHKEDEKATYKVMNYMCALGCASGLALFSPFVGVIGGATAGVAMGALTAHMKGGSLNKLLDDNETLLAHQESRARRKHVKQVVTEILLYKTIVLSLVPLLAMLFHGLGGDEDEDSWSARIFWLITYIFNKFGWEMYTPYRFDDLLNNIRSATASTSPLDRVDEIKKVGLSMPSFVYNTIFPRGTLYDTLKGLAPIGDNADIITNDPWSEYVDRGPYKNGIPYIMDEPFTKRQRAWFKALPVKNFYEEMYGSKEKNNYFKNQVMREQ